MDEKLAQYVSDGFVTAKNGDAITVYNNVAPYLEIGQLPAKSHYAFGWVIYYALHQQKDSEIALRKKMLANYFKLSLVKPHKLHSMVLTEALRLYKNAKDAAFNMKGNDVPGFSIIKFCELWNLSNLRPGDWRRKEFEGKETYSTVEKLITLYVDEAEETHAVPSSSFMEVIERALSEYPDSFTIMSQRAALHEMSGQKEEAKGLLKKALLYAPGKFFLWSRLAKLFPPEEDPRRHVALLYKGLRSPGQDQFKGRIRLSLAEAFVMKSQHHYALWELNHVKQTYEANGWHLPRKYGEAIGKIRPGTVATDPEQLYRKLESLADEEVYDALPAIHVTKTYHKNPDPNQQQTGKGGYGKPAVAWRVTDSEGHNYWLQPHRFKIPADLPLGTALTIRVHNARPVKAELMQ